MSRNSGKSNPSYKHGHATREGYTCEYNSWLNMRRRCYEETNNRYDNYGAIGLEVYSGWNPLIGGTFEQFLKDMGNCPKGFSLERKDLTRGYFPDNCIWADDITQANNKTNNILIEKSGVVWSLRRWCVLLELDYKSCWYYLCKAKKPLTSVLGDGYKLVKGNKWIQPEANII